MYTCLAIRKGTRKQPQVTRFAGFPFYDRTVIRTTVFGAGFSRFSATHILWRLLKRTGAFRPHSNFDAPRRRTRRPKPPPIVLLSFFFAIPFSTRLVFRRHGRNSPPRRFASCETCRDRNGFFGVYHRSSSCAFIIDGGGGGGDCEITRFLCLHNGRIGRWGGQEKKKLIGRKNVRAAVTPARDNVTEDTARRRRRLR